MLEGELGDLGGEGGGAGPEDCERGGAAWEAAAGWEPAPQRFHWGATFQSRHAWKARASGLGASRNWRGVANNSSAPSRSRAMRVASISASRTSCVTKMAVLARSRDRKSTRL